jgi:hypothetical protein
MKKIIFVSFMLVALGLTASLAAPAGTLSSDWSVSSSAIGPVRAAAFNPTTGNFLISVNTAVIVIDGDDGTILGPLPASSITVSSPMGICVDETGVIYMFDYGGSGYVTRWAYETDTAPIQQTPYPSGMGVPRGFRTYGSGVNTIMYQAGATGSLGDANDGPINILTTSDGTTFTVVDATEASAAKTGATYSNNGNTLYGCRPWGVVPIPQEGVTKWDKIGGVWTKDLSTFLVDTVKVGYAVVGDIDPEYNVLYVYNYSSEYNTIESTSNIVAMDATSAAVISELYIGTPGTYYGGVDVDRVTHKIYWAARTAPSTGSWSNWGRMTYTIPLAISIDSVTLGPTGNVILTAEYGTPPYTWSMSTTGIVSLSTTAGSVVTVNAIAPGTVDVILTDNMAVTKTCTVVVVPTSAEIWKDGNTVIIHRYQPLGELFE